MDFDSPDVMKDFPGLYSTEANKKSNDSDYSDDVNDKHTKKDLLIGKRKDKKDKKDRGYAALEGESSAEEDCEAKSPSKTKKTKSFKFTTKNKDKREKNREKEKDVEKKREKDSRKSERVKDKTKCDKKDKKLKLLNEEKEDIADVFPIFGVNLQLAVERSRCHDGIDLPLPVRNCIDYIQEYGISVENVYKISGIKSKVLNIKKAYNQREFVNLSEYDVPTATSVLKLFFRELPDSILADLSTSFEEAAAIQNVSAREISLLSLVDKLPEYNNIILAWTILHLDTITNNEKHTKMNAQSIAMALSPVLQMSHRLLTALLCHAKSLFKDTILFKYCPPLVSSSLQLPEESVDIMCELRKQESLLSQIHAEMNSGFISKKREELLWEVQRMITQLKRKLRSIQKCHEQTQRSMDENAAFECPKMVKSQSCSDDDTLQHASKIIKVHLEKKIESKPEVIKPEPVVLTSQNLETAIMEETKKLSESDSDNSHSAFVNEARTEENNAAITSHLQITSKVNLPKQLEHLDNETVDFSSSKLQQPDSAIALIQHQNNALMELKDSLLSQISAEKSEIVLLKYCLANSQQTAMSNAHTANIDSDKLDEIMELISKENRILQIKKTDLVREIMEQREACIYLQSKLSVHPSNVNVR